MQYKITVEGELTVLPKCA